MHTYLKYTVRSLSSDLARSFFAPLMFAPATPRKRKKRKVDQDGSLWTASEVIGHVQEPDGSPSRPSRLRTAPHDSRRPPPIPIDFTLSALRPSASPVRQHVPLASGSNARLDQSGHPEITFDNGSSYAPFMTAAPIITEVGKTHLEKPAKNTKAVPPPTPKPPRRGRPSVPLEVHAETSEDDSSSDEVERTTSGGKVNNTIVSTQSGS